MKKKIMKLVVILSMKTGLIIMKIRLFNYNLRNGIKKRYQKTILRSNRVNNKSFSKTAVKVKEG